MPFYVIDNPELQANDNEPEIIEADSLLDAYLEMPPSDEGDIYLGTFDNYDDALDFRAAYIEDGGEEGDVDPEDFGGEYDEEGEDED